MTEPPLSVVLLCGVLMLPAGVLVAVVSDLLPARFGIDYVTAGGLAAAGLLAAGLILQQRRAGAVMVYGLLPVYAFVGLGGVAEMRRTGVNLRWAVCVGLTVVPPALLRWPSTRRWCGRLPAAEPEDDA